jgi:hypothetical protein
MSTRSLVPRAGSRWTLVTVRYFRREAHHGRAEPGRRGEQLGGGRRSVRWRRQRLVPDLANVRTGDKLSS